jgi:hypothetical protein
MSELYYKELFCNTCGETTSHVIVDTVEGPKYSCEICGSYHEEKP